MTCVRVVVGKSISIVMGVGNVPIGKPKRILIAIGKRYVWIGIE
jgi:hypothetical protein